MRLVLDTSVLVAAFRSSRGASAELLRHVVSGTLEILCSVALAAEYRTVLLRPERLAAAHMSFNFMAEQKPKMSNYAARLVPTIRERAEEICYREGISLNQFLNLALMRQITFFEQQGEPRLSKRMSQEEVKAVLKRFLNRRHSETPLPNDELPSSYKALPVRPKKH